MSQTTSLHFYFDRKMFWNAEEIKGILERDPSKVNEVHQEFKTPLIRVLRSEKCSIDCVQVLLHYGAQVNCKDNWKCTPLEIALVEKRGDAVIKALLEKGANVLTRSYETTLCLALKCGASKYIIKLLLDAGSDPNGCTRHVSALECASNYSFNAPPLDEGVLKMMFDAGANLLRSGENGQSPMCFAFQAGAGAKDIEWLIGQGASLHACEFHRFIWLCATDHWLAYIDRNVTMGYGWGMELKSDVIQLLIKSGAGPPIFKIEEHSDSPLHLALSQCKSDIQTIEMLLHFPSVDPNVRNREGDTLLHSASENRYCNPSIIKYLIERGTRVDGVNLKKETPLHSIVRYEKWYLSAQCTIIEILLKNGSPVNPLDEEGRTPLRVAVESNRYLDVKQLRLSSGSSHVDIIRLLLYSGAQIGVPNGDDYSLLEMALNQHLQVKSQYTLSRLKLIVKYYFLENPEFKMRSLTRGRRMGIFATELKYLADEFVQEVQIMKSTYISDQSTLLDLIRKRSLPQMIAASKNPAVSNDCFNQLVQIVSDNALSHFFADITATVGKSAMYVKLQELQVYTMKACPVSSHTLQKVVLDYDSVCQITKFLTPPDTMNLILAYIPNNQIVNDKHSDRNNIKRKPEESEKYDKRPKLIQ